MRTINNDIEKLKKVRELIITIDMINGFVKEGSLAAPSIMRIVPNQIKILDDALTKYDTGIIFIRDSHKKNATEFKTYGIHCIEGTDETQVIDELKKYENVAFTYFKNSTNLIFAPEIQNDLINAKNLESVKLMGCLSDVCVENGAIGLRTFFDEINKDVDVCVYKDAIDTFSAPGHEADIVNMEALKRMEANGIKILGKRR